MVQIAVEDGGQPMLSDMATVNLTLTDVNDNTPLWVDEHRVTLRIQEVYLHQIQDYLPNFTLFSSTRM